MLVRVLFLTASFYCRTLTSTLRNYILPITVKTYKENFYTLCQYMALPFKLTVIFYCYKFNIIRDKIEFTDIINLGIRSKEEFDFLLSFRILCRYNKMNEKVTNSVLVIIIKGLINMYNYELQIVQNFCYFISHLCVNFMCNQVPLVNKDILDFFRSLLIIIKQKLKYEDGSSLFSDIYINTIKILTGSWESLVLDYNLPENKHYKTLMCPLYLELNKMGTFNFEFSNFKMFLVKEFVSNTHDDLKPIGNIISELFIKEIENDFLDIIYNMLKLLLTVPRKFAENNAEVIIDLMLKYIQHHDRQKFDEVSLYQYLKNIVGEQFQKIRNGDTLEMTEMHPLFISIKCMKTIITYTKCSTINVKVDYTECVVIVKHILYHIRKNEELNLLNSSIAQKTITAIIKVSNNIVLQIYFINN